MLIKLKEDIENVGIIGRTANVGKEQAHKLIAEGRAERYVAPAYRAFPGAHDRIQTQKHLFILHDTGDWLAGDTARVFDDDANFLLDNNFAIAEHRAGQTIRRDAEARRGKATSPKTSNPPSTSGYAPMDFSANIAAAEAAEKVRKNNGEEAHIALTERHTPTENVMGLMRPADQTAYDQLAKELHEFRDHIAAELKTAVLSAIRQHVAPVAQPTTQITQQPVEEPQEVA